ncbi:MAG: hypothetical protein NTW31_00105, partial [Bacteroidetes bacterium]|nr:hypothetical protein [Bacteroidota bacterium]
KGDMQITAIHAEVKLFDLFFSGDADFSGLKPGTPEAWNNFINTSSIKVYDYSSSRYIGRFQFAEKDNEKKTDVLFVFADGSKAPASACFSIYSMLKSKD